jgi:hypothetical protein
MYSTLGLLLTGRREISSIEQYDWASSIGITFFLIYFAKFYIGLPSTLDLEFVILTLQKRKKEKKNNVILPTGACGDISCTKV